MARILQKHFDQEINCEGTLMKSKETFILGKQDDEVVHNDADRPAPLITAGPSYLYGSENDESQPVMRNSQLSISSSDVM